MIQYRPAHLNCYVVRTLVHNGESICRPEESSAIGPDDTEFAESLHDGGCAYRVEDRGVGREEEHASRHLSDSCRPYHRCRTPERRMIDQRVPAQAAWEKFSRRRDKPAFSEEVHVPEHRQGND